MLPKNNQLMLPKNLRYGSKLESSPAKASRSNIAPQNGTDGYGLGATIIINLPTRRNLCLVSSESYLKFTCTVTNTNAGVASFRWDSCGAHGLFQRLRIFHGSNPLQDIDNYSLLAKLLFDLQVNTPSTYGKYNVLAGCRGDTMSVPVIASADATDGPTSYALATEIKTALNLGMSGVQVNSGAVLLNAAGNSSSIGQGTTTYVQTYCINLVSLLGSLSQSNYIPLFGLTSGPLRLELTLQDSITKIFGCAAAAGASAGTITVSNVEYIANFIELSDEAMSMVYESLGGQALQMVVPDYKNFQFTATVATGQQYNVPIPAKFSSLKSLFLTVRDKYNSDTFYPLSSTALGLDTYYFRIGPTIMPPKAPASYPEMFSECIKAIGSMGDLYHSPSIDAYSYQLLQSATLTQAKLMAGSQSSGSFYVGIDLENYANANKESIFAGMNTLTDDIYCTMAYKTVPWGGSINNVRFDIYALFDTVLVFENETCFARY